MINLADLPQSLELKIAAAHCPNHFTFLIEDSLQQAVGNALAFAVQIFRARLFLSGIFQQPACFSGA